MLPLRNGGRSLLPSLKPSRVPIYVSIYGRPILQKSFLASTTPNSKAVASKESKLDSPVVSLKERTKTSAKQRAVQKFATPEQKVRLSSFNKSPF